MEVRQRNGEVREMERGPFHPRARSARGRVHAAFAARRARRCGTEVEPRLTARRWNEPQAITFLWVDYEARASHGPSSPDYVGGLVDEGYCISLFFINLGHYTGCDA